MSYEPRHSVMAILKKLRAMNSDQFYRSYRAIFICVEGGWLQLEKEDFQLTKGAILTGTATVNINGKLVKGPATIRIDQIRVILLEPVSS